MGNLVISGASRGIGKAIVLHFALKGWNIAYCSRNEDKLNELQEELLKINPNGNFYPFICDVSEEKNLIEFAEFCKDKFSIIDILVNNAGVFIQGQLKSMPSQDFDLLMRTNVYSAFILTRELLTSLKKSKKALIVNMGSIAGLEAYANGGAYNVTKHALTGYSKTLRNELKNDKIAVSTLYPGAVLTDSWAGVNLPEERFIKASDIAQLVFDLYGLSDRTVVEDVVIRPMDGDI